MVAIITNNGKHKLTVDSSGDFRSMIALEKNAVNSLYRVLHTELERQCMRQRVDNILVLETMAMERSETIRVSYNVGFNIPIELASDCQMVEYSADDLVEITGRLERVDNDMVRYRRTILITPTQINAMSIDGNDFDETLASELQRRLNEYTALYPHRTLSEATKAL